MHAREFLRCLVDFDEVGILRLWAHVAPHLPQPRPGGQVRLALHHARTQSPGVPLKLRAYSHRWLTDNGYPSGLPDELKPEADRLYPRVVTGVGISVNSKYPAVQRAIAGAMSDAVHEAYADGHEGDPDLVRAHMMAARERERKGLML